MWLVIVISLLLTSRQTRSHLRTKKQHYFTSNINRKKIMVNKTSSNYKLKIKANCCGQNTDKIKITIQPAEDTV